MRVLAWACVAFGLGACQLVAGIKEVSSSGSGGKAGAAGMSGGSAEGGRRSAGGSSGSAGSIASGGGSGVAQGGAGAAQGGDAGGGGDSGEGGAGDVSGTGGRGVGGAGGRGVGGAGGSGAAGGGAGNGGAGNGGTSNGGAGNGGTSNGGAGNGGTSNGGMGGGAGTTAGSGNSSGMAGTGGAGPIRIMPLGDGITAGTCMRAFLWKELSDNGYPAFDFVGSRTSTDTCSPTEYDKNHEGHAGYRVSDLLSATSLHTDSGGDPYTGSSADLAAWFDGRPADIVLMLFGSNDFLKTTSSAADVLNAYSAILAKLRGVNPRVTLLVGLLPPMTSANCNASCDSRRTDLNTAMPGWATSASTADSPVRVVDLATNFDTANTTDGVKPNDVGAQFLADRWYAALRSP